MGLTVMITPGLEGCEVPEEQRLSHHIGVITPTSELRALLEQGLPCHEPGTESHTAQPGHVPASIAALRV